MDGLDAEARFQLIVPGEGYLPDLLGVWHTGVANGSVGEQLKWLIDLPPDRFAAAASLARQTTVLLAARQALHSARLRLDRFADQARLAVGGAVSCPKNVHELPAPERELAALLRVAYDAQAFSLRERLGDRWREIARQAHVFLGQVQLLLNSSMQVETTLGGPLIGRTTVGGFGDMKTIWRPGSAADQAVLHKHALALALDSRVAWIRAALHMLAGAARLSALFTASSGIYLAIPAAWQFIRHVLADAQPLQERSST